MYNKDLAEKVLEQLGHAYPKKTHLRELQETLSGFSNLAGKEWLQVIEAFNEQEVVICTPLIGPSGWEDAANIVLTNLGREIFLEDQKLEALGDKLFKRKAETLYEEVIRQEVPALAASLGGAVRSSAFANQAAELVFDRFRSLKEAVVESYIRPVQRTKCGITELRENRLRRKLDQLWEQELLRARGIASNVCQSTGFSAADVQPWVSQVEVRGRQIKLAVFDEIDIARLEGQPTLPLSAPNVSAPEVRDFSFVQHPELRSVVTRDRCELDNLDPKMASKSVLVLSGAIIEALLLDALVTSGEWDFEKGSRKNLNELIQLAIGRGIIREDRLSHAVRNYRNLVHLGREIREEIHFTHDDSTVAKGAVGVITNEVRRWHLKRGIGKTASL
jgi:hypothetical protein